MFAARSMNSPEHIDVDISCKQIAVAWNMRDGLHFNGVCHAGCLFLLLQKRIVKVGRWLRLRLRLQEKKKGEGGRCDMGDGVEKNLCENQTKTAVPVKTPSWWFFQFSHMI
jgi:hypothetical protein